MAIIEKLKKISDVVWELPATYKEGMRVPARIVGTEKLVREMDEAVYQQISNVATLPGITRYALCMPDGHSGYGFPSAVSRRWTYTKAVSFHLAASGSTSIVACAW
jgi:tRNA-splicing ligase RtcB